jgi:hypothetical protein
VNILHNRLLKNYIERNVKMKIFTLYDKTSKKSEKLFLANTTGEAERQFLDAITMSPDGSLLKSHPGDFDLYCVGDYNESAPDITVVERTLVINGLALLESSPFKTSDLADASPVSVESA